jgi:hypothetical protein
VTGSLDAEAAQRVVQRANELAVGVEHRSDGYQPEAIISAALEVGIPERAARQSLAIERLGRPPEVHIGDGLFGPARLWDQRVIELPADHVLELLDQWLVIGHHLRRHGVNDDEVVWSHRDDFVAGVRRRLSGLVGEGRLARARSVRARIRPVDESSTVVRVVVDRHLHRRAALIGGWTLGAGGVSLVVAGALVAAPLLLLAVPVAAVGGALVWASRRQSNRFRRELDRVLGAIAESRAPRGIVAGVKRRLSPSPVA